MLQPWKLERKKKQNPDPSVQIKPKGKTTVSKTRREQNQPGWKFTLLLIQTTEADVRQPGSASHFLLFTVVAGAASLSITSVDLKAAAERADLKVMQMKLARGVSLFSLAEKDHEPHTEADCSLWKRQVESL